MNTVFAGLLLVAVGAKAPDAGTPTPAFEVVGTCPAREAVMRALLPVLGKDALASNRGPTRVADLGDRFEVAAAGQAARYVDTVRDCGARARVAAVFIALALSPPSARLGEPPAPPVEPPAPLPEPPAPPREPERLPAMTPDRPVEAPPSGPPPPLWVILSAGARLDGALAEASAPSDLTAGGELSAMVGRGAFGVAVSAAVLAPSTRTLQTVSVRQQRFPFSADIVLRHRLSPGFALTGQAGVALVLLTLRGENVKPSASSSRLDPGAHLSIVLRGPAFRQRLVPFVGFHAELFPRSYFLDVDPVGQVGVTNRFWWGATAGLSFDLATGQRADRAETALSSASHAAE